MCIRERDGKWRESETQKTKLWMKRKEYILVRKQHHNRFYLSWIVVLRFLRFLFVWLVLLKMWCSFTSKPSSIQWETRYLMVKHFFLKNNIYFQEISDSIFISVLNKYIYNTNICEHFQKYKFWSKCQTIMFNILSHFGFYLIKMYFIVDFIFSADLWRSFK